MTYAELCGRLERAGCDAWAWDAALLLEHFCGADRMRVHIDPQIEYGGEALERAVSRREAHEPLQYILGEWEFYRQRYEVSPDCLIPRQDTELLVEEAILRIPKDGFFADLCTGSGCIAVSTLAERTDLRALAVELSEGALKIAIKNAARNGVSDRFCAERGDVLALSQELMARYPKPDAILSNPPYIRTDVLETLSDEVKKEPRMALDGGADGMLFYRALVALAEKWLAPNGFCLFEIGYDQGEEIMALARENGFRCTVKKDLGGNDRVAYLRR